MHDDRRLIEERIDRELWQRVLPLAHPDRRPVEISAGPTLEEQHPIGRGDRWGPPWATTWFRLRGAIPDAWHGRRNEAIIDLGFHPEAAGFQCEGLLIDRHGERNIPVQGIHPRRMAVPLDDATGAIELLVEAASNPMIPQFQPTPMGDPATAPDRPLYRFRRAELVTIDPEAEALVHDLDVLDGVMRSLPPDDPRRARLSRTIEHALDVVPDIAGARAAVSSAMTAVANHNDRHRVIAVGHAHIDTAWLWPTRETLRKCTRTFASAVGLMDRYPDYRFVASSAQHYEWMRTEQPELFRAIRHHVNRGQWIPVGGMWVESDMNLPSGESLARQIVFGQRWFEHEFGRRCTEVWIPDVFGYPAGLPQVFAAGGMDRFVTQKLSWNKQNRFPHSTFWWEGLDGTRVLTHFPPVDTYNAEITSAEVAFSVRNFQDAAWSSTSLMPFGWGDGGGGPTREMVERARRMDGAHPDATVEMASPADFFEAVEAEIEAGADAPVWRGELYFETHRGTLTSQLRTKMGNRRCERLLVEAELWAATAGEAAELDDQWRAVLTQQFHDILPGSSIAWAHQDAERVFAEVAAHVEQRIAEVLDRTVPPGRWVANPADAAIDGVTVFPAGTTIDTESSSAAIQTLADGDVAVAISVPPMAVGPRVAQPVDDQVALSDTSMSNHHLAVRWGEAGTITSVISIDHAREILPAGRAIELELAVDQPVAYDAWDLESWTRRHSVALDGPAEVVVVDHGPLVGRVVARHTVGPSTFEITTELRAGDPALYMHVDIDWHHDEHLLSFAVPLDVRADTASCDVQFGVVSRPTHPSSPWDAAKFEVCAHRFVDVSEPSFGVAVLNDGRYGHSVFDGAIRVSLARAAKYPDPGADQGRHRVTLAVLPHGPGLTVVRDAAARLNAPVRPHDTGSGSDRRSSPIVRLLDPDDGPVAGVAVDAVKLADDDSGDLIVRCHEALGDRRHVLVVVADGQRVGGAWRCNLLEEPDTPLDVADGVVELGLHPFELVTVRLRRVDHFDGRTA
ncbi:MAG: alpha-mannosidase [Ilumatobacteraceae bacterium]|nr:alpha-mannosidase [Ilumatobacteraceae bacterium]